MILNWEITNIKSNKNDGRVLEVHIAVGTDLSNKQKKIKRVVQLKNSSDTFIPYEKLEKNKVLEWVKNELGEKGINAIKKRLENKSNRTLDNTIIENPF